MSDQFPGVTGFDPPPPGGHNEIRTDESFQAGPGVLTGNPGEVGQPGNFRQSGPFGVNVSSVGPGLTNRARSGGPATELNLAGQFEWDPPISGPDEIAELRAGRWMPQTADFVAVAGGTVPVVPTFGNFLGAIVQRPDGGISRLNLFSHGDKSLVAFGGRIQRRNVGPADVFLDTNGPGDNMTAMDPTSMANLNQPGVTFTTPTAIRGKTSFTVADVRKKFAEGAFVVLYLCHSGQDAAMLSLIAKFLGVKVIGFNNLVGYYPPAQTDLACIFHKGIEQRSGGSIIMVEITRPNESADHRFFGDRL